MAAESSTPVTDIAKSGDQTYFRKVHTIGRIFTTLMIFANALPVFLVWAFYGIFPDLSKVIPGLLVVWGLLLPLFLTEGWMYYTLVGVAANYMSWAGNSSNFRVPVIAVAQEVIGTKPGTMEAEIVGNIAGGTSIFFSVFFILLGALLGNAVMQNLPPWVTGAFAFAIPCIFGALIAQFAMRGPKYALFIVPIAFLLVTLTKLASWQRLLLMLVTIMPLMWLAYKKLGWYWVAGTTTGDE